MNPGVSLAPTPRLTQAQMRWLRGIEPSLEDPVRKLPECWSSPKQGGRLSEPLTSGSLGSQPGGQVPSQSCHPIPLRALLPIQASTCTFCCSFQGSRHPLISQSPNVWERALDLGPAPGSCESGRKAKGQALAKPWAAISKLRVEAKSITLLEMWAPS